MFGYACDETPTLLPLPIYLAHKLTRRLAEVRKNGTLPWLRPDGKSQVTVEYRFGKPHRIDSVIISTQHAPEIPQDEIHEAVKKHVILPVIDAKFLDADTKYFINPTGRFVIGGPLVIPVSLAAKSSSIPTAVWVATVVAALAARTPQKLTVLLLTRLATPPRMWLLPV